MLAIIMIINIILDLFLTAVWWSALTALKFLHSTPQRSPITGWDCDVCFFIMLKKSEINLLQIYTVFLLFTPIIFFLH